MRVREEVREGLREKGMEGEERELKGRIESGREEERGREGWGV